jgi:serine phosphatase RsbU (regulator of sigma subunit)
MRILVAWDTPEEADLLQLYLGAGDHEVLLVQSDAELLQRTDEPGWDVILMALTYPQTAEDGFALFDKLQARSPDTPVVVACRQGEMLSLPRFLIRGLRFYMIRDEKGEFVFLVLASLESALMAVRAEESRKLAEKLREEMDGVRRLQESVIPRDIVPPPGYSISARYESAQLSVGTGNGQAVVMAGGDYYDLFAPDDQTLVVILGDAAGHGLKACMSIMTMHTLIRMFRGDQYRNTGSLVAEVNDRLCENSIVQSGGGFITLFYAAIDTRTHTMTWTSAGHPLALLQDLATNEVTQVGNDADGGLPLGISPGLSYTAGSVTIPPGSRLVIYTDGLTDAFPPDGDSAAAFGVKGIRDAMRTIQHGAAVAAVEHLFRTSHNYTGGIGRHDDTSIVVIDRNPL